MQTLSNWPPKGKNMIVYPQAYHLQPTAEQSFVDGVTSTGEPVRIYLVIDPNYLKSIEKDSGKTAPSLAEFARTDRRAHNPCVADPSNGPHSNTREGVMLFSRVFPTSQTNTFIAKWAVVLACDSDSPAPIAGIGRMEINHKSIRFETPEVIGLYNRSQQLRVQMQADPNNIDQIKECLAVEKTLEQKRFTSFSALLSDHTRTTSLSPAGQAFDSQTLKDAVKSVMQAGTTDDGRYGVATVRVMNGDLALSHLSFMCGLYYSQGAIASAEGVWDRMLRFERGAEKINELIAHPEYTVQIIPGQRILCGPKGNANYCKPDKIDEIKRIYTCPLDARLTQDAPVVARPIKTNREGNLILGSLYATGSPIGNILQIGPNEQRVYRHSIIEKCLALHHAAA